MERLNSEMGEAGRHMQSVRVCHRWPYHTSSTGIRNQMMAHRQAGFDPSYTLVFTAVLQNE